MQVDQKNQNDVIKKRKKILLSLAQLVEILHIIFRGRGSNPSPHLKCVSFSH